MQFDYGSQFASYEPNAIKIWASTATATSILTINDLRITTPGVAGTTPFPGTVINVSQASGTVFQEIIIAGIDFRSVSGGTVTLEGNVTMQFGADPALRGSALQFHVIATHIPWVDLDVDSNNDGTIDLTNGRRGTDDRIEPSAPGKIIPVGGARAEMLVTVPASRNATLEIDAAAADKIRVHKDRDRTQNTPLTFIPATANTPAKLDLSLLQPTSTTGTLNTWQLWVEALAPSTTAGDLVFTLTGDSSGPPARDIVRATAVEANLVAHRTGGRLGDMIPENLESAGDPNTYMILTNRDFEQGLPLAGRDFDDEIALLPPLIGPEGRADDDLAKITLKRLPSGLNVGSVMKQVALGRKNWMFIGSVAAGYRAADLMTLVSSAARNDLDVFMYVKDVLDRLLAGESNYDVLRPDVWKQSHPEAIRIYRQEERRSRADAKAVKRARRRIAQKG